MQCFRCHADNAEGSRFCGNCGAPFGTVPPGVEPHVTDPTSVMPAAAGTIHPGLPPLDREGLPIIADDSLGGSLRAAMGGRRRGLVMTMLVVDAVMVIAGWS